MLRSELEPSFSGIAIIILTTVNEGMECRRCRRTNGLIGRTSMLNVRAVSLGGPLQSDETVED